MMPALHEDLRAAQGEGLLDLLVDLIEGDDVGVGVVFDAVEGAELAIDVADVGVIDVAIDDVGDDLVAAIVVGGWLWPIAGGGRPAPKFFQRQLIERQGLGAMMRVAVPDFLEQARPSRRRGLISFWINGWSGGFRRGACTVPGGGALARACWSGTGSGGSPS